MRLEVCPIGMGVRGEGSQALGRPRSEPVCSQRQSWALQPECSCLSTCCMLRCSQLILWAPRLLLHILITPGAAATGSSEPQIPSAQQNSPLIEAAALRSRSAQSSSKPLKGKISWQPISQGIVLPKPLALALSLAWLAPPPTSQRHGIREPEL